MTEEFQVGVITQTHGIRGELKVFPTTDDVSRFKKLKEVYVDTEKNRYTLNVASVKYFKQYVIIRFKEYDDINQVEFLKGAKILVDRKHAVRLEKDEFFIADLIGLECVADDGEKLGFITDVLQTGANDVYVISNENEELLVPAISDCVKNIDIENKIVTIHMMEGLR